MSVKRGKDRDSCKIETEDCDSSSLSISSDVRLAVCRRFYPDLFALAPRDTRRALRPPTDPATARRCPSRLEWRKNCHHQLHKAPSKPVGANTFKSTKSNTAVVITKFKCNQTFLQVKIFCQPYGFPTCSLATHFDASGCPW